MEPVASAPSDYVIDPGTSGRLVEPTLMKRIIVLGLPVVVGMLTQTLINQVDGIFIGGLPEAEAVPGQAAMGPSLILLWAFGGFLSAISVGTQALTARRVGEGDVAAAGQVLTNAAVIAIVSSIVATVLALQLVPVLFPLMHSDPDVQRIGIDFCRVRFWGIVPMVLMAAWKSFYDGTGRTSVHMVCAIAMNVVNFALCYLLVNGNWGAPRMGVTGSAWAAVLSASVGYGLMLVYSLRSVERLRFQSFQRTHLNRGVAWAITKLSFFSGVASVIVMTGFFLFLKIPAELDRQMGGGTNAAAAWDIITIMMVVFMTCLAFGTATATLVAQSLGARNAALAKRYGWQSVMMIVVVMMILGGLVMAMPETIMRIFLPSEGGTIEAMKEATIRAAVPSLRFTGILAPLVAAALVLTQALYGAGESRFVMIVEGVLHFAVLVPLAYVFSISLGAGLIGCWYATAIYGALLLAATAWRFARGTWANTAAPR
jgi:multidrug resistance protein, MATE family